MDIRVSKQEKK
jgi:hypothetical protein